jgi:hypothetical protein
MWGILWKVYWKHRMTHPLWPILGQRGRITQIMQVRFWEFEGDGIMPIVRYFNAPCEGRIYGRDLILIILGTCLESGCDSKDFRFQYRTAFDNRAINTASVSRPVDLIRRVVYPLSPLWGFHAIDRHRASGSAVDAAAVFPIWDAYMFQKAKTFL